MMNRDLLPEVNLRWLEPLIARRNPRMIFDFDDAIHLGCRGAKLKEILPYFAAVVAGNEALAEFARQVHHNVTVLPTVVDTDIHEPATSRAPGPIRIGWSGSAIPMKDYLPALGGALSRLSRRQDFEFVVICNKAPEYTWPGVPMTYLPWNPPTEVQHLQRLDIGVMPLSDRPFEGCKCGAKAILYMATGIPAVVSPVGVNAEIVVDGVTGFHCVTEDDWVAALERLIRDGELRRRMGAAGRERAVRHYSITSILPRMMAVLEQVAA